MIEGKSKRSKRRASVLCANFCVIVVVSSDDDWLNGSHRVCRYPCYFGLGISQHIDRSLFRKRCIFSRENLVHLASTISIVRRFFTREVTVVLKTHLNWERSFCRKDYFSQVSSASQVPVQTRWRTSGVRRSSLAEFEKRWRERRTSGRVPGPTLHHFSVARTHCGLLLLGPGSD